MEEMTISEVARRAGMRASAIRYYEQMKVLPVPKRISGQRRYDASVLPRLSFIKIAQELGFTVAEMKIICNNVEDAMPLTERWQTLARKKLAEVDVLMNRAMTMKRMLGQGLHCGCLNLDDCINCVLINCQR